MGFQSTRPCGARHEVPPRARPKIICFNPRARAGRDAVTRNAGIALRTVSIHAPVRGATPVSLQSNDKALVSIHAPVRGATWATAYGGLTPKFQSTRPCGARRLYALVRRRVGDVSIHAPVRGAT